MLQIHAGITQNHHGSSHPFCGFGVSVSQDRRARCFVEHRATRVPAPPGPRSARGAAVAAPRSGPGGLPWSPAGSNSMHEDVLEHMYTRVRIPCSGRVCLPGIQHIQNVRRCRRKDEAIHETSSWVCVRIGGPLKDLW